MQKISMLGLVCASLLGACADGPQLDNAATAERGEMVTGSNIPRKRGSLPTGVERVENEDLKKAQDRVNMPQPTGGR